MSIPADQYAMALEMIDASTLDQDAKEYLKDVLRREMQNEVYEWLGQSLISTAH